MHIYRIYIYFAYFLLAILALNLFMIWTKKDDVILIEFEAPIGHTEVEMEIHPTLINGPEPYVNNEKGNVILIEPTKAGKQQVLIRIRPRVLKK